MDFKSYFAVLLYLNGVLYVYQIEILLLQGYVRRQALYSCLTCVKPESEAAGICLACSLECHDGHELVELYTKRYLYCKELRMKFDIPLENWSL